MNRFFARIGNWVGVIAAFAVTCSIGYNIYQQNQISRLQQVNELIKAKESLVNDSFNEILMARVSELRENMAEVNRNQGKVEGMVAASLNLSPEQNHTSAIWHEGYYRGLGQVAMIEESAYISGYHRATEDMGCPASVRDRMNAEASRKYQQDKQIDIETQQFNNAIDEAQKRREKIESIKKNDQPQPNPSESNPVEQPKKEIK